MAIPLAAVGPIISGVGAGFGAITQSKNAKLANDIALLNYYEQQRANNTREALGRESLRMQQAPVTTGTGTKSGYDRARGFYTELSPLEAAIAGGALVKNAQASTQGIPQARFLSQQDTSQRIDASNLVDALLSRVSAPSQYTPSSIAAELRNADRRGTGGINRDLIRSLSARSLSSGGLGENLALKRALSGGLQGSTETTRPYNLEADEIFRNRRSSEEGNTVNLINALRGTANAQATPMMPQFQADSTTANMQARSPQAYGLAIGSVGASELGPMKDSYALSNFLNSAGSAIYGYGQYKDQQEELKKALSNRQRM